MGLTPTRGTYHVPKYYIPTPSLMLNRHLVGGGIASGSIAQFGSKSPGSWKTSIAAQMIGYAQAMGLDCCYIDAEAALDLSEDEDGVLRNEWFENMGVDVSKLWFIGPGPGEEIWEQTFNLIEKENVKLIVMDSIHAVQPTKLHDAELGGHSIGQHAMLHTKGLLKSLPLLKTHDATIIGINHKRPNITQQGQMGHTSAGGKGWGFYSKYIFEFTRSTSKSAIEDKDLIPLDVYVEKSKGGSSYFTINTFARQGYGIDQGSELAQIAITKGLVVKAGSWFKLTDPDIDKKEAVIGKGADALSAWAAENKDYILR